MICARLARSRARRYLVASVLAVFMVGIAPACSSDDASDRAATTTEPTDEAVDTTTKTDAPSPPTSNAAEAIAAGICPEVPPMAEPDPDRPVYTVDLTADPASPDVTGTLSVVFTPDLPVDELVFRLWPNGPVLIAEGVSLSVGEVTDGDGRPLATEEPDPTTLVVPLDETLEAGESIEVSMPFELRVAGVAEDRISRFDGSMRLATFLPLLAWEPGVGWALDAPTSLFAEATTTPTADFDVGITVPDGVDVLATGRPDADGRWRADAVRDFAISLGRFDIAESVVDAPDPVEVTVGVHEGMGESPDAYLARVVEALEDFSVRFGAYPWPSLTVALTPVLGGGIEYPMHIMLGPEQLGRTTPHEVGHMWFYSLVGNNQGSNPWLDESLATYAESHIDGFDLLDVELSPSAMGHAGESVHEWEENPNQYFPGVYVHGAQAVDSLGDRDMVDCMLRHYVAENAFGIATPADFFEAMEPAFPDVVDQLAPYGLQP